MATSQDTLQNIKHISFEEEINRLRRNSCISQVYADMWFIFSDVFPHMYNICVACSVSIPKKCRS